MVADSDGPFVVVTGDPNLGRGERLSRARSHLTSRYHRQRRQQSKLEKSTSRKNQGLLSLQHSLSGMPNEVSLRFPAPQLSASPTGYSRMRKCRLQSRGMEARRVLTLTNSYVRICPLQSSNTPFLQYCDMCSNFSSCFDEL